MGRKKISKYILEESIPLQEKVKRVMDILELTHCSSNLPQIIAGAKKEKLSYEEFLDQLYEIELFAREDARLIRWKKQAKFPWTKDLESYDFTRPKDIDREKILELAKCEWIKHGGNIVFFGPTGVGKTHLSIALGLKAIEEGYGTRFIKVKELAEMIDNALGKDAERGRGEYHKKLLNFFTQIPLLILDDVSYSNLDPKCSEFLFHLFYGRYDARRSTILTGNEGFESWINALFSGNKEKTAAVVDRFMETGEKIVIAGDSYRISTLREVNRTYYLKPTETNEK